LSLERQSIEKKDFPIGRRGYDPDAVDAHLTALANEIEELKRSSRRRTETLASSASEQVRAIVEAAENSAADITRQAEEDAREIKAEAASEAGATREHANVQAREYVSRVSESTAVMLQRLEAMESELGALIESLKTGSNRLNADLQLLEGNLGEVREAVAPPRFEPEPEPEPLVAPAAGAGVGRGTAVPPAAAVATPPLAPRTPPLAPPTPPPARPVPPAQPVPPERPAQPTRPAAVVPPAPELEEDVYDEQYDPGTEEHEALAAGAVDGGDDTEGARLIALNMALNGTPREETDRYLAENFTLADRAGLLNEVYASVEG
jgi:DivIVA domain-containing protein